MKQDGGAGRVPPRSCSWRARRTISTGRLLAQMPSPAAPPTPLAAVPLSADEQKASLGELVKKTGRQMREQWLEGIRGGLARCKGALQSWQFERAQQAKMVSIEDYLRYLGSVSHGQLLSEEMRAEFGRCVGLSWTPEAPFTPWSLLFERLFPESMGYDVSLESAVVELYGEKSGGRPVELDAAYLYVRRATLDGDGPVLLIVGGFDKQAEDRLHASLDKLTGRIAKAAADLMHSGQARERMLWLAFCAQDFCWGHVQGAGVPAVRAAADLHVQQAAGQRALLQLAEQVHSLLIGQA